MNHGGLTGPMTHIASLSRQLKLLLGGLVLVIIAAIIADTVYSRAAV